MKKLWNQARPSTRENGFSLVEVMTIVVILGVLFAIAVPAYMNQKRAAERSLIEVTLNTAASVLKQDRAANSGRYPESLPAEVVIPNGVTAAYTRASDLSTYCLSLADDLTQELKFLRGNANGTHQILDTSCEITDSGVVVPLLSGDMSNVGEPILTWSKSPGATYEVFRDGALAATVSNTTWRGPKITKSTNFYVRAVSPSSAVSSPSNTVSLRPTRSAPTIAPNLSLLTVTGSQNGALRTGTFTWTAVAWATRYELRSSSGATLWSGSATNARLSAKIGQKISAYVVGINDIGVSPQSNTVTLNGPVPDAPTLSATTTPSFEGLSISLAWSPVIGAKSYDVYKGAVNIANTGSTNYTDSSGWNLGGFQYTVIPLADGNAPLKVSNAVYVDTFMPPPESPSGLSVVLPDPSGHNVSLTWGSVSNAVAYAVEYFINGDTTGVIRETNGTGISVSDIVPGTTIAARVKAIGYSGSSSFSPMVTYVRPMPAPVINNTQVSPTQTSLASTCSYGSVQYRYRENPSGAWGAWSAWSASASANHAPDWGKAVGVQWEVRCINLTTGDATPTPVAWNPSMPIRPITVPIPTSWNFTTPVASGTNATIGFSLNFATASARCENGLTLQTSQRYSHSNETGWRGWSGWVSNPGTTVSHTRTTTIGWGLYADIEFQARCLATNGLGSLPARIYAGRMTATIPLPTGLNASVTMFGFTPTASCPAGTTLKYAWTVTKADKTTVSSSGWVTNPPGTAIGVPGAKNPLYLRARCEGVSPNVGPIASVNKTFIP